MDETQGRLLGSDIRLVRVVDADAGTAETVEDGAIIGRGDDAAIRVRAPDVSGHHARLRRLAGGRLEVEDLGSANGTWVNGSRIDDPQVLRPGDRLRVGARTTFVVMERGGLQGDLCRARRMESSCEVALAVAADLRAALAAVEGAVGGGGDGLLRDALGRLEELCRRLESLGLERDGTSEERVDLSRLVKETVSVLRASLSREIVVHSHVRPGIDVHACRADMEQAVLGLCLGASRAMPDGGKLRVELSARAVEEDDGILPLLDEAGRCVRLLVEDTGPGISAAEAERACEPLRDPSGGVGLAGVYAAVRRAGGQMRLAPRPGGGTRVELLLPLAAVSEEACTSAPGTREVASLTPGQVVPGADEGSLAELLVAHGDGSPGDADAFASTMMAGAPGGVMANAGLPAPVAGEEPAPPPRSRTVLLVDDEEDQRQAARDLIGLAGYEVLEAGDGEEALSLLDRHGGRIGLVFLDLLMPGMSGVETFYHMRAQRPPPAVVLMSGYGDEMTVGTLRRDGVAAFLRKPFSGSDLQQALEAAERARQARAA